MCPQTAPLRQTGYAQPAAPVKVDFIPCSHVLRSETQSVRVCVSLFDASFDLLTLSTACSLCPYGSYIQSPCAVDRDTVCSTCSKCGMMQYASRPCELGADAICSSCMRCAFDEDPLAERTCKGFSPYFRWADANCCKVRGKSVLCRDQLNHNNPALMRTVDISGTDSREPLGLFAQI